MIMASTSWLKSARNALESIPKFIKKAGDAADEVTDSKKYVNQVRNAVDDAKGASGKAKETAGGLLDKVKDVAGKAAEQAKHATEVGKEKLEDRKLSKQVETLFQVQAKGLRPRFPKPRIARRSTPRTSVSVRPRRRA